MAERLKISFFTKHVTVPFLKIWINNVTGLGNVPRNKSFILAPNHNSYIEHYLIGSILMPYLKKGICILAKKEHFDTATQRNWHKYWSRYVSTIPIDRSKGEDALKSASSYLKNGGILVVYPEGTRSLTGKLQKAKTGVARLALLSKAPVVPIGLIGTFEILPKGKYIPRFKRATMNIGKPMHFPAYYNKKINKRMLREVTTKIMKEIAKLSKQRYDFD